MTNQELDAAVATDVMGWEIKHSLVGSYYAEVGDETNKCQARCFQWHPTTDTRDTERVIAKLQDGCRVTIYFHHAGGNVNIFREGYEVGYGNDPDWKRAVCLAAINAVS